MANSTTAAPNITPHKNVGTNASSLGATTLVTAPAGRIRVLQLAMITTLANNVKFMTNATDISATFPLAANGGLVLPFNEHGWFETVAGDPLVVNLSVATSTGIQLQYILLP
jgi:hypothetical protein